MLLFQRTLKSLRTVETLYLITLKRIKLFCLFLTKPSKRLFFFFPKADESDFFFVL